MGFFDDFADRTEKIVSSAPFFAGCVLLVVVWAPSILFGLKVDTWQLIINTATTIITFLLLALLTNTQARFEDRVDRRLEEILRAIQDAHDPIEKDVA